MQRGFCAGIVLVTSMMPACWASAAQAQALAPGDTRAAEARMVYSYSATQANLLQASDQKIMALRGEVDGLQNALSVSRAELHRLRSQGAREAREAEARIAALEAQLTGVQERAVAELAARDRRYAIEIDRFRGQVASVLETPEGQRAVNEILAGNVSVGAEILDRINAAEDAADEAAAERQVRIAKAKRARQAADLLFDRAPTGEMIKRYEHIVALDDGIDWDWLRLADLRSMAGYHESAIEAARTAVERAVDEAARQRAVLSLALILSRGDRIGEAVTVLEAALFAAGVASNGPANASALEFAVEARLLAADLLADRDPARAAELTQAALGELDTLLTTASREEAARLGELLDELAAQLVRRGDRQAARQAAQRNVAIARTAYDAGGTNDVRAILAGRLMRLALVEADAGELAAAEAAMAEVFATLTMLPPLSRETKTLYQVRAAAMGLDADLHAAWGRESEWTAGKEQATAAHGNLHAAMPEDRSIAARYIFELQAMVAHYQSLGDEEEAERARDIFEGKLREIAAADPANRSYALWLAHWQAEPRFRNIETELPPQWPPLPPQKAGCLEREAEGEPVPAPLPQRVQSTHWEPVFPVAETLNQLRSLGADNGSSLSHKRMFAQMLLVAARQDRAQREALAREALAIATELERIDPLNLDFARLHADARELDAQVSMERGNFAEGEAALKGAVDQFEAIAARTGLADDREALGIVLDKLRTSLEAAVPARGDPAPISARLLAVRRVAYAQRPDFGNAYALEQEINRMLDAPTTPPSMLVDLAAENVAMTAARIESSPSDDNWQAFIARRYNMGAKLLDAGLDAEGSAYLEGVIADVEAAKGTNRSDLAEAYAMAARIALNDRLEIRHPGRSLALQRAALEAGDGGHGFDIDYFHRLRRYGYALLSAGRKEEASQAFAQLASYGEERAGQCTLDHRMLLWLADAYQEQAIAEEGNPPAAKASMAAAVRQDRAFHGRIGQGKNAPDDDLVASFFSKAGKRAWRSGDMAAAERLAREGVAFERDRYAEARTAERGGMAARDQADMSSFDAARLGSRWVLASPLPLARALVDLALLQRQQGLETAAAASLTEAADHFEIAAAQDSGALHDKATGDRWLDTVEQLGSIYVQLGQNDRAISHYRSALAARRLRAEAQPLPGPLRELSGARAQLVDSLSRGGRTQEARSLARSAVAEVREAIARYPEELLLQLSLADLLYAQGDMESRAKAPKSRVEKPLLESLRLMNAIVRQHPAFGEGAEHREFLRNMTEIVHGPALLAAADAEGKPE